VARRLALIAHDNKKVDFVAWATFNRKTLAQFDLIATRYTARLITALSAHAAAHRGSADAA
jgi:methylglyoxal synthase